MPAPFESSHPLESAAFSKGFLEPVKDDVSDLRRRVEELEQRLDARDKEEAAKERLNACGLVFPRKRHVL